MASAKSGSIPRKIVGYVAAVACTYVIGVILVSQFNITRITEMGFSVSAGQRVQAVAHDLVGMLGTYLPLISIALLIAFLFTSLGLLRFIKRPMVLFVLAGFVAIIALHTIMGAVFGVDAVAPVRSLVGLVAQGMAGAVGGYVYGYLRKF